MATKTVWKHALAITDGPQELMLPRRLARVVLVAMQHGELCVWFEVNPDEPKYMRYFAVYGTGHSVAEDSVHIGSVVTKEGALVWHVFEVKRP